MENALKQDTLISELAAWNRQEQQFGELFSEGALKDRTFQRMKLGEFNRLYYKYAGTALSRDNRAMMLMLRYQRTRLRKLLYPGLLRRLLHRVLSRVQASLEQRRSAKVVAGYGTPEDLYQIPAFLQHQDKPKQRAKIRHIPSFRYRPSERRNNKSHGQGL